MFLEKSFATTVFQICFSAIALFVSSLATGDVVSFSVAADVEAGVESFAMVTAGSTLAADTLLVTNGGTGNGSTANSITGSSLTYEWDGTTLSGNGLVDQQKTKNAKPGGIHSGQSVLVFNFTIDGTTSFSIAGTYGYSTVTGTDDITSWSLKNIGTNTTQSGTAAATSTGINSQSFSSSDVLEAGDYTFTMSANFTETINSLETRQAGWNLTGLTLIAVPEPSGLVVSMLLLTSLASRRRRFVG